MEGCWLLLLMCVGERLFIVWCEIETIRVRVLYVYTEAVSEFMTGVHGATD